MPKASTEVVPPSDGADTDTTERSSPLASESFARTSIVTARSVRVTPLSARATGAALRTVTVTVADAVRVPSETV